MSIAITRSYSDTNLLTAAMLNDICDDVESCINNGGIDSSSLASGAVTTAKLDAAAVTTAKITDANVTRAKIEAAERLPIGSMTMFCGPIAQLPAGWLECDGTAISRTTYSDLFTAIGTAWGTGNGSTTFNLPDMRGMFPRGYNHGKASGNYDVDAGSRTASGTGGATGDNVGSYQANQNKAHTHTTSGFLYQASGGVGSITYPGGGAENTNTATATGSSGGTQAQPENVSVLFIIKY